MEKVTSDGVITIEESKTAETYNEVVEGMQFDRGYLTPYMVTDTDKMEAVWTTPLILITDKKISVIQDILPLLEQVMQNRQEAADHRRGHRGRGSVHPDRQPAARHPERRVLSRLPASATAARRCCRISPP